MMEQSCNKTALFLLRFKRSDVFAVVMAGFQYETVMCFWLGGESELSGTKAEIQHGRP